MTFRLLATCSALDVVVKSEIGRMRTQTDIVDFPARLKELHLP